MRPLVDITKEHHFNEVFFDSVKVEKKWMIGEKNRGWYQIASQLDYERSGIERLLSNYPLFRDTVKYAREQGLAKDPLMRNQLAQMQIELDMGRFMVYKVAWLLTQGFVPNHEAAMAKCFCTEVEQRIAQTVCNLLGDYSVLLPGSPAARLAGRAAHEYLYAPAYTIQGGTSNVLRNIMAIRGLGSRLEGSGKVLSFTQVRKPSMLLANKVAFITGSARGSGAGIARVFAREGARLC